MPAWLIILLFPIVFISCISPAIIDHIVACKKYKNKSKQGDKHDIR